jgi:hypothetical protein
MVDAGGAPDAFSFDAGPPPAAELTINPALQDFGDTVVGETSSASTFTVENVGTGQSSALTVTIGGADAGDFAFVMNGCAGMRLAAGDTCTVSVEYSPGATGRSSATLNVAGGDATTAATLQGNGIGEGDLRIAPSPHNFGTTTVGSASTVQVFTVTNPGGAPTAALAVALSGSDAVQFQLGADTCTGMALAAGATCTVEATHEPMAAGTHTTNLTVTGGPSMASASLNGTAVDAAGLVLLPTAQDFGSVATGSSSADATFTLRNTGGMPTPAAVANTLSGANASEFQIVSSTCAGAPLPGGATCNIVVRFNAASAGAKTASLDITAGALTAASALTATGLTPGSLSIAPSMHAFGTSPVGTTVAAQTFTVTNPGGTSTGALTVAIAGANPADFVITSDGCSGAPLGPAGTCTVAVEFNPIMAGMRSASLRVVGTPGGMATANLTGTGEAPAVFDLTPTSTIFGSVATGSNSSNVVFTVRNTGTATSGTPAVAITGVFATEFTIVANTCTTALAGGATCTVTVRFNPTTVGMKTAVLEVSGSPGGTDTADISGTGITPANLTASTSTLAFGNFPETMTTTLPVVISNTGAETSGALAVSITGADAGQFMASGCTGMTLAMGANCTITVTFAPTSQGSKVATLNITGMPGGALTVGLGGTGTPDIEITPNPGDFGGVNVGSTTALNFSVRNRTTTARTFSTNTLTGADAAQFTFIAGAPAPACTSSTALAAAPTPGGAGGVCNLRVQFAPTGTAGARAAFLNVTTTGGGAETGTLRGNANGPVQYIGWRNTAAACPTTGTAGLTTTFPAAFGDVAIGQNQTIRLCVRNTGAASPGLIRTSSTFTGDMLIVGDTCNGLNPGAGANCNIDVRFFPRAVGAASGQTTITYGANSAVASITGNGVTGANITVTGTADFGTVLAGATADQTFTVTNTGAQPSAALGFTLTTPGGSTRFATVTGGTCVSGTTVLAPTGMAGSSCTIVVRLSPTDTDDPGAATPHFQRTLRVAQGAEVETVALRGNVGSRITVTPTAQTYTAPYATTSAAVTYTVRNVSTTVTTGSIVVGLSTASANFPITNNTCLTLSPGGSCTFDVAFLAPSNSTPINAQVQVSDGPFGTNLAARAVAAVTGTGQQVATFSISPTTRNFGSALVGANTGYITFTVTNTGTLTSAAITTSLTTGAADYDLGTSTCTGTLAGGASCTVQVRFSPSTTGTRNGNLRVTDGTGAGTANATLSGTGASVNSFTITPNPYDFGSTPGGTPVGPVTFTAVNNGGGPAAGVTVVSSSARYLVSGSTCTGTIAGGASCTFNVTYSPPAGGPHGNDIATVNVNTTTGGYTAGALALTGRSLAPAALDLTPNSTVNYGNVATGRSGARTFTVTNTGGVNTTAAPTLSLGGANPSQYAIVGSTCTAPLAGGASCTFSLEFRPTTIGAKNASITATAGALSDTTNVTGSGVLDASLGINITAPQTCADHAAGTNTTCVNYTITNGGDVPTTALTVAVTGDFTMATGSGLCQTGQILNGGASCTARVVHSPSDVGADAGVMTISATIGGSVTGNISSNGISAFSHTGGSANLGSTAVTGGGTQQTLTFTNAATTTTTGILFYSMSGANAADFDIVGGDCVGGTEIGGGTCTLIVEFAPSATGSRAATLTVGDGTAAKTAVVSLTGTGT